VTGAPLALAVFGPGLAGDAAHVVLALSFGHANAAARAPFDCPSVLRAGVGGAAPFAETPDRAILVAGPLDLGGAAIATPPARRG
jgi:hypothetical protein